MVVVVQKIHLNRNRMAISRTGFNPRPRNLCLKLPAMRNMSHPWPAATADPTFANRAYRTRRYGPAVTSSCPLLSNQK